MVRKYQKTEYKQWSDDDIATLIEFYPNTKTIDLVPVLHRSKQSIDHKAQRLGLKKTDELLFDNRSARRGEKSPTWKGGRSFNEKGYVVLTTDNGRVLEHREIMEKHLGRKLEPNEVVHHINGNKADNRIENLEVMTNGEHTIKHHTGQKRSEETRRKISEARRRNA